MKKNHYLKAIALLCMVMGSLGAWADGYTTVYSSDFEAATDWSDGWTTSGTISQLTCGTSKYLHAYSGASATTTFGTSVATATDYVMEFDWNVGQGNGNARGGTALYVSSTNGYIFYIDKTNAGWSSAFTIYDSGNNMLGDSQTGDGYIKESPFTFMFHFKLEGKTGSGVKLTVTNGATTILNGVTVSTDFYAPTGIGIYSTNNAGCAGIDNVVVSIAVADNFCAEPTSKVTGAVGVARKFTLECVTEGATIYYSETEKTAADEGWSSYSGEVVTSAETIWAYAKTASGASSVMSFATGAGESIVLNAPTYIIGEYFNGAYTLTLSSNQESVLGKPETTISYKIDGGEEVSVDNGDEVDVPVGSTIRFWAVNTDYSNSVESSATPSYIDFSAYTKSWSMDFVALSEALADAGGFVLTRSEEDVTDGYKSITNEGFNENFGVNDVAWQLRYQGAGKVYNTGLWPYNVNGTMVVMNLSEGSVVVFEASDLVTAISNATKDEFVSVASSSNTVISDFNNYTFIVGEAGNATFGATKSSYIGNITVYKPGLTSKAALEGYKTFYSEAANYKVDKNTTIYIAKVDESANTVTLSPMDTKIIPQYCAVILKTSDTENYEITLTPTTEEADWDAFTENELAYFHADEDQPADPAYVLGTGSQGLGFYLPNSLIAGDIYITVTGGNGAPIRFVVEDEATAIKGIDAAKKSGAVYNVAGQRVNESYKGIVVKDGKKYLQK